MNPTALTVADLLAMLQAGACVDSRDGMNLTSATEPLREAMLELDRLRLWRDAVRHEVHAGATGFAALDRANAKVYGI
jgi:hypothetical protein